MKQDFLLIKQKIDDIVSSHFCAKQKDKINEQINFINSFQDTLRKFLEKNDLKIEPVTEYNKKTVLLIERKFNDNKANNFNEDFGNLVNNVSDYFGSLAETLIETQPDERFKILANDSYLIKNYKRIKKFFLILSHIPVSTGNLFRKIFKKELKQKRNWNHTIPFRNITFIVLRDKLFRELFPIIEDIDSCIASSSSSIWEFDESINKIFVENSLQNKEGFELQQEEFGKILKNLEDKSELLDKKVPEIIESVFNEFGDIYEKAGTIEFPKRKFNSKKVSYSKKKLNEDYKSISQGWQNSFFTLFEGWRLDKELYILCGKSVQAHLDIKSESEKRINKIILSELGKISSLLQNIKIEINEFYGDSSELLSLFYKEKEKIFKQLSAKIIPSVSEIILAQNIPELAGSIEISIENFVQNLSTNRAIIKSEIFTQKIKTSEIDYISPKEIISFASLTKLSKTVQQVNSSILKEIQKIQNSILDIDQIADFNLDTAISMFHSDERTGEDPLDIAAEGIERAAGKTSEIEKNLIAINENIEKVIGDAVNNFNNDLIELTKTEKILDIKIRIAKVKALQRTTRFKEQSVVWFKNIIPLLKTSYEKGHGRYQNFYNYLRKRLGLTPKLTTISSEISDFLAATQTAVTKLPVVYRRLFEIEALKDERFFEGREAELNKLNSAYENWKKGGYAPVSVVGENGSGATTLLNFFAAGIEKKYNILRTEISEVIYKPDDLNDFFKSFLKIDSIKNLGELTAYLNNLASKKIIIIENVQHLFLRKVNGFLCLKILFELISKTQKNIFWITTLSLYAWQYLSKTLNIADYFGYVIEIKSMRDEQMVKVILKRHKISGYNLNFKPSKEDEQSKSYKKMSDEKKQEYLTKQYFSDLNKFAKSNISLALLFWLRSTKEVSGDTITIGSLRDIDFSFLSSLETSKIFTLNALLIHDGLTIESFSLINNLPVAQSRLMLFVLLDDGVIIQKNGLYKINPLLYRQTVTLLQTKNIVH